MAAVIVICDECDSKKWHIIRLRFESSLKVGHRIDIFDGQDSMTGHVFRYSAKIRKIRNTIHGHKEFLVEGEWGEGEREWVHGTKIIGYTNGKDWFDF